MSWNCPGTRPPTEAKGTSGSQPQSQTRAVSGEPYGRQQDTEFQRLSEAYSEASVTNVTGALGPLYYAPVEVAGEVVPLGCAMPQPRSRG